jgi:hypothetical protein
MRKNSLLINVALIIGLLVVGCDKNEKMRFPETPPDQVVLRFFELLGEGGKLTNREAMNMVSNRNSVINQDNFRRWTENYSRETKLNIVKSELPTKADDHGDWIATVRLEVKTPSIFGGDYTTTSRINMILDQKENVWKLDFLADTVDEEEQRKAPAEVRVLTE